MLAVVYLIFNEGYTASAGERARPRGPVRRGDPARPPARRADARRARGAGPARADAAHRVAPRRRARRPDGELVLLADQDRARWDRALIAEGQALVRRCLRRDQPGPVPDPGGDQRRAQRRAHAADTDWRQILALYDQLLALAPTPGGRAQPRRRGGRGATGPAPRWRSSTGSTLERLPPVPRDPRRPAAAARPRRRGRGRLRRGGRAHGNAAERSSSTAAAHR